MKKFDRIDSSVQKFAEIISKEVAARRFYDIEEVSAYVRTRLHLALHDLVKDEVTSLEDEKGNIVRELNSDIPAWQRKDAHRRLTELSPRLKQYNQVYKSMRDYNEYQQLKHWLKDKFGTEFLKDFYDEYLERGENGVNKKRRTT